MAAGIARREVPVPPDLGLVTPAQWPLGRRHLDRRADGHVRLGAAVLRDAWDCLVKGPQTARSYQDAVAYFLDPAQGTEPVSFELACSLAGVDPEHVRRGVRAWLLRRHPEPLP